MMTARDDYPDVYGPEALDEIDRLRVELERCERRNEQLRKHCDEAVAEVQRYRAVVRTWSGR